MSKETIAICVSSDVMEYVNEMIEKRRFADVSHAFELMAFEHIEKVANDATPPLKKFEEIAMSSIQKSTEILRGAVDTVQESAVGKKARESVDMVTGSPVVKSATETAVGFGKTTVETVKGTVDRIQESDAMKSVRETMDKVSDSPAMKTVTQTAEKVQQTTMDAVQGTMDRVKETISPTESGDESQEKKPRKIEIEDI